MYHVTCVVQLYGLQLNEKETWQTWPENINLLQFLDGGRGLDVIDLTITSLMTDISGEMTSVATKVDTVHTALKDAMQNLRSALVSYNASTFISETFV